MVISDYITTQNYLILHKTEKLSGSRQKLICYKYQIFHLKYVNKKKKLKKKYKLPEHRKEKRSSGVTNS